MCTARGCVMSSVGTADVPAAGGTSDRAVPSGVSTGIHMVLVRDGEEQTVGAGKAVVNINGTHRTQVDGYGRLGTDRIVF